MRVDTCEADGIGAGVRVYDPTWIRGPERGARAGASPDTSSP